MQKEQDSKIKCYHHKEEEVIMINFSENIIDVDRFLCSVCLRNQIGLQSMMNVNQAILYINQKYIEIKSILGQSIIYQINNIESSIQQIRKLKECIINNFLIVEEEIIKWKQQLTNLIQFHTQVDNIKDYISFFIKHYTGLNQNEINKTFELIENFKEIHSKKIASQIKDNEELIQKLKNINIVQNENNKCLNLFNGCLYQDERCCTIDFNMNGQLFATRLQKIIHIYKIQHNSFSKLIELPGHTHNITSLKFSKKFNWLISGGDCFDKSIRLWKENNDHYWIPGSIVKQHTNTINCIIMNKDENLLISSSDDYSIIFWKIDYQNNSIEYSYTLNNHIKPVYQIELNQQENQLISTSKDQSIIIWKIGEDQKYFFYQQIKTECFGARLTFINENKFIWLQNNNGMCRIFEQINDQQYQEQNQLQLQDNTEDGGLFFPCNFNQQLQILYIKHNKHIYYIKIEKNKTFSILQQLEFEENYLYGGFSQDGKYGAFWDSKTKYLLLNKIAYL